MSDNPFVYDESQWFANPAWLEKQATKERARKFVLLCNLGPIYVIDDAELATMEREHNAEQKALKFENPGHTVVPWTAPLNRVPASCLIEWFELASAAIDLTEKITKRKPNRARHTPRLHIPDPLTLMMQGAEPFIAVSELHGRAALRKFGRKRAGVPNKRFRGLCEWTIQLHMEVIVPWIKARLAQAEGAADLDSDDPDGLPDDEAPPTRRRPGPKPRTQQAPVP